MQSLYDILGVSPQSNLDQIRDAYRAKSKQCHPDTTMLNKVEAAQQFLTLNTAYDTLRIPEKRSHYDQWLHQQQLAGELGSAQRIRPLSSVHPKPPKTQSSSAFLGAEDRALSAGEVFALFILGLTFVFCLVVAIFLGVSRGEMLVASIPSDSSLFHQLRAFKFIPKTKIHNSPNISNKTDSSPRSTKTAPNGSAAIHPISNIEFSHPPVIS
jgi:curved DNA-binding protein CbpA